MSRRIIALLLAVALVAAACADDDETTDADSTDDVPADVSGEDEAIDAGSDATPEAIWVEHEGGPECACADGSEFSYWSRTADPEKVVLYYQGGGACFSADTCDFEDGSYKVDSGTNFGDADWDGNGIFDFDNPENPLADWSFVFVPYCTGDVHIGDNVHAYTEDLEVNHNGFVNASHGLDHIISEFPGATDIFVTGSSAGGVPAPLFAGLASDAFPEANIASLSDASGAYPDNPPVNAAIGGLWGTMNNTPDWEVNQGMTPEDFSIPGLITQSGLHDPEIRFARFDNAYDNVQEGFSRLAEIGGDDQLVVLLDNEAQVEAEGVNVSSYVAPGTGHTILGGGGVYTLEVEGVRLLDWLTEFVEGGEPADVVCTECGRP